ncbi:hypothetical protein Tco_1539250 [Tanacetum coccineum]
MVSCHYSCGISSSSVMSHCLVADSVVLMAVSSDIHLSSLTFRPSVDLFVHEFSENLNGTCIVFGAYVAIITLLRCNEFGQATDIFLNLSILFPKHPIVHLVPFLMELFCPVIIYFNNVLHGIAWHLQEYWFLTLEFHHIAHAVEQTQPCFSNHE